MLAISVVWLVILYRRGDTAVTKLWIPILGLVLSALPPGAQWVGWVRRRHTAAAAPVTAEQVGQAVATLAEVVTEQWAQEATARLLWDLEPMPVRWQLFASVARMRVVDHPEATAAGPIFSGSSERITDLVAAFRSLDRRRLVIIGGPGTGKTTLAVQLLLELLEHPQPGEPVPVLFSLVGWDPQDQSRLQDWLTSRLERDYPMLRSFGVAMARALVERGKILPILDGLDEVPATLRPGIITALNNAAIPAKRGLILTSRCAEYAEAVTSAGDVLTAAAVIAPLALSRIEAASYLRKHLPAHLLPDIDETWFAVLDQLATGTETAGTLAAVTASPLGLWLVRTVYLNCGKDPTPLVDNSHPVRSGHSTLQAHLLDQLIPAVLRNRPPAPRRRTADPDVPLRPRHQYNPDDVRRWLTTCAEELRDVGTRDWLWWHLARHTFPTGSSALMAKLMGGLLGGLVIGLAGGLAGSLVGALVIGLIDGSAGGGLVGMLVAGLACGLVGGLAGALMAGPPGEMTNGLLDWVVVRKPRGLVGGLATEPEHIDLHLRRRLPELVRNLEAGLVIGTASGLALGWTVGLWGGPTIAQSMGLLVGLAGGLLIGLRNFLTSPSTAQRAAPPGASYRGDRSRIVVECLMFGLAFGLAIGLTSGLVFSPEFGLAFGLPCGLAFGLAAGLAGGAWPAFVTASVWLALRRRLPWRLITFLEDAHSLGLLRATGSAYQFRHAELQNHLAPRSNL